MEQTINQEHGQGITATGLKKKHPYSQCLYIKELRRLNLAT
jgi:hypothetical protein